MTSEASASVNLLDSAPMTEGLSIGSSPSASSVLSDLDRQSPALSSSSGGVFPSLSSLPSGGGVAGGGGRLPSAPSSPSPYSFLRNDTTGASTSRSSIESSAGRADYVDQLAQNIQYRRRRRTNSSDSSGSDDGSVGGASHVSSIGGFSRSQDIDDDTEGSRKASVETPIRQADMPRGRLANIRRESSCTPSDEMAHERMTTAGIQVSSGWYDAMKIGGAGATTPASSQNAGSAEDSPGGSSSTAASPAAAAAAASPAAAGAAAREDELNFGRRRAMSLVASASALSSSSTSASASSSGTTLSELSILTHAWIPHSCSPSPTRMSETTKQCYSPSTQKIVRANIPYSPSPSPTASPTRKRLMTARSQSPIASRSTLKRRADGMLPSSPVSGVSSPSMLAAASAAAAAATAAASPFQLQPLQFPPGGSQMVQPPAEKRACPGGAMGGYVRNSTSPLVIMDARAAAAAFRNRAATTSFLVDPEIRRASTDGYSDGAVDGNSSRDGADSISEPSSVLMPTAFDAFDADALLFRAPSVPPPASVGSNCSSQRYESAAADAEDTKSTIDTEEEKMEEEESAEDLNTSTSSQSLFDTSKTDDESCTPSECSQPDDVSQKEETAELAEPPAMEE